MCAEDLAAFALSLPPSELNANAIRSHRWKNASRARAGNKIALRLTHSLNHRGQSNMVGLGKVKGGEISLEHAVKEKKKYQYLVDDAGAWTERKDVRYVQYMSGKGPLRNEWMTVAGGTLGPEYGLGHPVGNAIDAPVMILKCCIGNRTKTPIIPSV
jgi:hypothetical protein